MTYELTGYPATGPAERFRAADLVEPDPGPAGGLRHRFTDEVPYEAAPTAAWCRRPVERTRTLYRSDDLTTLLPLGRLQALGLVGESYALAFTPGLLTGVLQRPRAGGRPRICCPTRPPCSAAGRRPRGLPAEPGAQGRRPLPGRRRRRPLVAALRPVLPLGRPPRRRPHRGRRGPAALLPGAARPRPLRPGHRRRLRRKRPAADRDARRAREPADGGGQRLPRAPAATRQPTRTGTGRRSSSTRSAWSWRRRS